MVERASRTPYTLFDSRIRQNSEEFHGLFVSVKKEGKEGREREVERKVSKNCLSAREGCNKFRLKGRDQACYN